MTSLLTQIQTFRGAQPVPESGRLFISVLRLVSGAPGRWLNGLAWWEVACPLLGGVQFADVARWVAIVATSPPARCFRLPAMLSS